MRLYTPLVLLAVSLGTPAGASESRGSYLFALGELLAGEGAFQEALAAYDAAVVASPADPYLRTEYADFLMRLDQTERALAQIEIAERVAPENLDVLRVAAQIQLALADRDPAALERARQALERIRIGAPDDVRVMISLGQLYLQQGRVAESVAVFEEVARLRPNHPLVTSYLVDSLLRAERDAEAEQVLRQVVAGDPEALESRLALADLISRRGDAAGAIELLAAAPPAVRGAAELRRRLTLELLRGGELGRARQEVEALLLDEPDSGGGRYLRGLILSGQGELDAAARELGALLQEAPDNTEVAQALARVRERQGRGTEAEALLASVLQRLESGGDVEEAARTRLQLALIRVRRGDWAAVERTLAEKLDGGDGAVATETVLVYAEALASQQRPEAALAALRRRPADRTPAAWRGKEADLLYQLGRPAEAAAVVTALATSSDLDAVLVAAEVHQRRQEHTAAIPLFIRYLAGHPDADQVRFALGAAYERTGSSPQAAAVLRELIDRRPDFAPALNYLGYMWAEQGENLDEALALVRRAVALDPDNGAYVDSLGWAHYRLGEYAAAREQLERAARMVPNDATILEHLGDVYVALAEGERARDAYVRALELASDNREQVQRKLDRLAR